MSDHNAHWLARRDAAASRGYGVSPAGIGLGLDWFLLNLFLLALVFVPRERAFPHRPRQPSAGAAVGAAHARACGGGRAPAMAGPAPRI